MEQDRNVIIFDDIMFRPALLKTAGKLYYK